MFKNYLKTAWRSLVRNKSFSLINITGLSIGIAASLLLFIVVQYELGYDTFHKNYQRIYRVVTKDVYSDGITYNSGTPAPTVNALRAEMPEATYSVLLRLSNIQITAPSPNSQAGNRFMEERGIYFTDPQFFQLFSYTWLSGTPAVLAEPYSAVLTKETAEKYFGSWQQALGQTINISNNLTAKVNGIIQTPPANTDLLFSLMVSYKTALANADMVGLYNNWNNTSSSNQVFALLPPGAHAEGYNKALLKFSKTHYDPLRANSKKSNFLEPLSDLHFDRRFDSLGDHITSKATLLTLSFIGLFIVLMACVNFINLATALAVNRSKEVGIRKVLGGNRKQLFIQNMSETATLVGIAMLAAICIVYMVLPHIKHIASIPEQLNVFSVRIISMLIGVSILVTLLAGSYPSLVMSALNPISALKNKLASTKVRGVSLRRGLVVMQFTISQVLIIATAVAVSQMDFVRNADLGLNKESVLLLSSNGDSATIARQASFKQQLLQLPGVQSVSLTSDAPSSDNNWSTNFSYNHQPDEKWQVSLKFADADYLQTFGLQLAAGNYYTPGDTATGIVVNETLVQKLGIKNPEDVIGKELNLGQQKWRPIVGVVKDFKTNSLRDAIKPLVLLAGKPFCNVTAVKIKTARLQQTVAAIQKTWDNVYPEYVYAGSFFDETIDRFYRQETQLSLLYKIFAGLAIFISCLGLYGLVSFMAVQKTKEVGIRKVLGASVTSLVQLFSKEFTVLIIVSFFIAAPLAWWLMHNWLNNFTYRISLGAGFFAMAIISSVLIAWLSVGIKAIRAALANPIKSLRSE